MRVIYYGLEYEYDQERLNHLLAERLKGRPIADMVRELGLSRQSLWRLRSPKLDRPPTLQVLTRVCAWLGVPWQSVCRPVRPGLKTLKQAAKVSLAPSA